MATWSPQGKLFQVEYARESVKQGSAALGLTSKTHVVLAALKRSHHDLSTFQEKVFEIDSNKGIAIAGLTSDARALATFMRLECLNYQFNRGHAMITGRLVALVADKHQNRTMMSSKRPYGVGLLVAGVDRDGPHLYETDPSGVFSEYRAMAIGARSQSARTYFERNYESFPDASVDELIAHALRALQASASDTPLTAANTSLAVIGKNEPFSVWSEATVQPFMAALQAERAAAGPAAAEPMEGQEAPPAAAPAAAGGGDDVEME